MSDPAFEKFSGSGVCDVCNSSVGPNEAYKVPTATFYESLKYKEQMRPLAQMFGVDVDAYVKQMKTADTTEYSAVCSECVSLFV
jgi:uncharacterized protein YidB (DUF937 family)